MWTPLDVSIDASKNLAGGIILALQMQLSVCLSLSRSLLVACGRQLAFLADRQEAEVVRVSTMIITIMSVRDVIIGSSSLRCIIMRSCDSFYLCGHVS